MALISFTDKVTFIESVFGAGRMWRNSNNFDVCCPVCDPKDKSKKKLSIKLDDDANHCWVCGWKSRSLAPLLAKYSSQSKLIEYRDRFMTTLPMSYIEGAKESATIKLPDDFKLLMTNDDIDPDASAVYKYMRSRNVSDRDMWYFKVGTSHERRWSRMAIVPSFNSLGTLNYFIGRAIDERRRPKYDNADTLKTPIIFNELNIDWSLKLVLCEGVFDLMKCVDNTVPLLGSDLNEQSALFDRIIVNNTPVVLALDADMWNTKTLRIAKKLAEYNVNVSIIDTREFQDPGQATKVQFKEAFDNASQYDWLSKFKTKLQAATVQRLRL